MTMIIIIVIFCFSIIIIIKILNHYAILTDQLIA